MSIFVLNFDLDPTGNRTDVRELLLLFSIWRLCLLFFFFSFPIYVPNQFIPLGPTVAPSRDLACFMRCLCVLNYCLAYVCSALQRNIWHTFCDVLDLSRKSGQTDFCDIFSLELVIYIYVHMYIHVYIRIYVYIYIERQREKDIDS